MAGCRIGRVWVWLVWSGPGVTGGEWGSAVWWRVRRGPGRGARWAAGAVHAPRYGLWQGESGFWCVAGRAPVAVSDRWAWCLREGAACLPAGGAEAFRDVGAVSVCAGAVPRVCVSRGCGLSRTGAASGSGVSGGLRRLGRGVSGGLGRGCGLFLCVAGHGLGERRAFGGCLGTRRR
jgi:hypothetical protein